MPTPSRRPSRPPTRRSGAGVALAALAGLLLAAPPAPAQPTPAGAPAAAALVSVAGVVLDAASGQPVPGAILTLRDAGGARPARTARADAGGRYLLAALPPAEYRVTVRAVGYHPATVGLALATPVPARLSIALQAHPIELAPVRVAATPADAFGRAAGVAAADDPRLLAERARRRASLASDARAITAADVAEAVTLAEPDLFRALQRLPGVATRDDYSAELWTRGAPWSQTLVQLDGVPLFNPLHAAGGLSAVGIELLGGARFHPGAQPVDALGGAAGRLDLATRAEPSATLGGTAELSLLSGRLAAGRALAGGRGAWALAARRSHLDLVSRVAGVAGRADSTPALPYAFGDVAGRADLALGGGRTLEASALVAWDGLDGPVRRVVEGGTARWGSAAGRVTLAAPLADGALRLTAGGSRLALHARSDGTLRRLGASEDAGPGAPPDTVRRIDESVYLVQPMRSAIAYLFGEAAWAGRPGEDGAPALRLGVRLAAEQARHHTTGDWPRQLAVDDTLSGDARLWLLAAWADRRWRLGALEVEAGARAEAGTPLRGAGALRLAPRLGARLAATPTLAVSAALSRGWQHAQTIAPLGPGRDAIATAGMFWLLADDAVPALRADLATLGVERWLGEAVIATATVYGRRSAGVLTASPADAGGTLSGPPFVGAEGRAAGLELGVRRIAGRWTGSAAYALQRSTLEAHGARFAAPWERRHLLQVTAAVRVTPAVGVGAAFAATSGAPYTPFFDGMVTCADGRPPCSWAIAPGAGPPSSARLPGHAALDLTADWTHRWAGERRLVAYAQLKNALDRRNPGAYLGSGTRRVAGCPAAPAPGAPAACGDASPALLPGLRAVPAVGLRLTF